MHFLEPSGPTVDLILPVDEVNSAHQTLCDQPCRTDYYLRSRTIAQLSPVALENLLVPLDLEGGHDALGAILLVQGPQVFPSQRLFVPHDHQTANRRRREVSCRGTQGSTTSHSLLDTNNSVGSSQTVVRPRKTRKLWLCFDVGRNHHSPGEPPEGEPGQNSRVVFRTPLLKHKKHATINTHVFLTSVFMEMSGQICSELVILSM